ncbi:hypothetical protein C8R46DRAFT_311036 [Mycena filopes]|nr:hypothetical protein C8R46DRAFT_311036 [Mycena filopes]
MSGTKAAPLFSYNSPNSLTHPLRLTNTSPSRNHGSFPRPFQLAFTQPHHQGSIFSAIGRGINAVVSAIAGLIMAIVGAITTVIVTIFDVIVDILCCRCGSRRSGGRRHRRRAGRGGAATY